MKRKIIQALLAVAIAIGLWMYVVMVVNPEWEDTFYNIPVILENEEILHERGLMLMSEEEPKVTLRLSGNRTDMIKLNNANITLRADLSRIYSAGEQRLSYSIAYPDNLPNNAFEIISQAPQQISLSVVERKSKAVDVVLKVGNPDPGYIALKDEAKLDYEKITVSGPAEVVDRIAVAEITIDLAGQKETIQQNFGYVLKDAAGNVVENEWIKASPENIYCELKIQRKQEVMISVDILAGAGLTAEDCEVTYYDKDTGEILNEFITISGSEVQLGVLQSVGLLAENKLFLDKKVDLSQMCGESTQDGGLQIVFEKNLNDMLTPYEIQNQSGVNIVQVVVKIPGQSRKEVKLTTFTAKEVPMGMIPDFGRSYVTVTLRGPEEELAQLEAKDLKAEVNLTGATPSADGRDFPVTITLNGEGNVFVVGTYKVNVIVSAVSG